MTIAANDEDPMGFEERAAQWCWQIAEGALDPEEQFAFEAWLRADPRHQNALEDMVTVWQGTDAIAEMQGFLSLRAKALTAMEQGRSREKIKSPAGRSLYVRFAAAAAILLMVITSVWYVQQGSSIYSTGIGERRVVRLDDGSEISLDAVSRVEVDYSGDHRALTLEYGRAKFDVAKDPLRPFTVTAAGKTVVATGTSFSVELLQDQVRVFLYEGHVAVLRKSDRATAAVPGKMAGQGPSAAQLQPGEEMIASVASGAAIVAPADVELSLAWEAGRLSFIDEPLASAVERVNRYSDTPITISDPGAGRILINGVFDAGDTQSFVSGVVSLHSVVARREQDRIILSRKLSGIR